MSGIDLSRVKVSCDHFFACRDKGHLCKLCKHYIYNKPDENITFFEPVGPLTELEKVAARNEFLLAQVNRKTATDIVIFTLNDDTVSTTARRHIEIMPDRFLIGVALLKFEDIKEIM